MKKKRVFKTGWTIDEVKYGLVTLSKELGKIPTKDEIIKCEYLPSVRTVVKLFKENESVSYIEYLINEGYEIKKKSVDYGHPSYDELLNMWDKFFNKHKKYPTASDCLNKENNLPTWTAVRKITKECFYDFKDFLNHCKEKENTFKFNEYIKVYIEESNKLGRYITTSELNNHNKFSEILPSSTWLVENCPDKNVKTFNDLLISIGFEPTQVIPKDIAVKKILNKQKELNRPLFQDDFINVKDDEISVSVIKRIWGSFNNMLIDLGFEINQENMVAKNKDITELKKDIIKLCHRIYKQEGRKNISGNDVIESEDCLGINVYQKAFKKELNMTLSEFIKSIGFIPNDSGVGMNYKFDDGEITKSKYEYYFSLFLKENNIIYDRDIKYKDFINNYNGNMNCDYIIYYNNVRFYIEIAGMLRGYTSIDHAKNSKLDSIHKRYLTSLIEKEQMLKSINSNYLILFPIHLDNLQEIFTLINNNAS